MLPNIDTLCRFLVAVGGAQLYDLFKVEIRYVEVIRPIKHTHTHTHIHTHTTVAWVCWVNS